MRFLAKIQKRVVFTAIQLYSSESDASAGEENEDFGVSTCLRLHKAEQEDFNSPFYFLRHKRELFCTAFMLFAVDSS